MLAFATPVYLVASVLLVRSLRRVRPQVLADSSIGRQVLGAWLLALALTIIVWWLLGFVPDGVLDALVPSADWLSFGVIVALPATIAAVIAFGAIARRARRAAASVRTVSLVVRS